MSDAFDQLRTLAPPPEKPVENGTVDKFRVVEEHLKLQFPSDYKQVIRSYGHGTWRGGLILFNPFTSDVSYNLIAAATGQLEEAEHHLLFPEDAPFPLYPEPGGLLPWAKTEQNEILYWLTDGDPETWRTIFASGDPLKYQQFDLGCSTFLFQWLQRTAENSPTGPFLPAY
jgi:hypothetical protein